jgi:nucleotide-binding universal stress UspA family protein
MTEISVVVADDMNQSLYGAGRSRALFQVGVQLASLLRGPLIMIHVDNPSLFHFREPLYRKFLANLSAQGKRQDYKLSDRRVVQVFYQMLEGKAAPKLVELMNGLETRGVVVLGTKGRFGFRQLFLGSVTKKVLAGGSYHVALVGHGYVAEKRDREPLTSVKVLIVVNADVSKEWQDSLGQWLNDPQVELEFWPLSSKGWFGALKNTEAIKQKVMLRESGISFVVIPKSFPVNLKGLLSELRVPVLVVS